MRSRKASTFRMGAAGLAVGLAIAGPVRGQFVVSQSGGGTHTTIQAAIQAAGDGYTITVMPGTYDGPVDFLGKSIILRSSQPLNAEIVEDTVIRGVGLSSVVVFQNQEPASAVLEGFTITQGVTPLNGAGGGIRCEHAARPTIRNNVISGNWSQLHGGGIACVGGSAPRIEGNDILLNIAEGRGAGIFVEDASPYITGNKIHDNFTQDSSGGGIHLGTGSGGAQIVANTVYRNIGVFGGGIHVENAAPLVARNHIYDNLGAPRGGGMSIYQSNCAVVGNVIAGNRASIAAAIDMNGASPLLRHNTIVGNLAGQAAVVLVFNGSHPTLTSNIVAFHPKGIGVQLLLSSSVTVEYNCFYGNTDGNHSASVTLGAGNLYDNPQLVQLGAFVEGRPGGGVPPGDSYDLVATLVGQAPLNGVSDYKFKPDRKRFRVEVSQFPPNALQQVYLNGSLVGQFITKGDGTGKLEYDTDKGTYPPGFPQVIPCDEVEVSGAIGGKMELEGIGSNCTGMEWQPGDEHLLPTSPCIDAGKSSTLLLTEVDFDGNVRQYGPASDIGADEHVLPGTGDFDGDGDVDLRDAAVFQRCFGSLDNGLCVSGDFDGSGFITLPDLAWFAISITGP